MFFFREICLITILAMPACTPKPTDPYLTGKLEEVSKSVDSHYAKLVTNTNGVDCRYSNKINNGFWHKLESDLTLLNARATYWPQNNKFIDEFELFSDALEEAKQKEVIAELEPTRLTNSSLWYCLDSDEASRTWYLVSKSIIPLISASKISAF